MEHTQHPNVDVLMTDSATEMEVAQKLKKEVQQYLQTLDQVFEDTQGKAFLFQHTKAIDSFLNKIYKLAIAFSFHEFRPMASHIPIVLCALGSYGREQLSTYSDIDLMIVFKEVPGYNLQGVIEKILYLAWDCGLKIGHRVHEIEDLEESARSDITIKTAMLESRFICGSKSLDVMILGKLQQIRKDDPLAFMNEKMTEFQNRYKKYPLVMEPNVKEGYGGIRDANTLYWLIHIFFGVRNIKDSQQQLGFDDGEYREFRIALEHVYKVRTALHLCACKKQDKLILELIPCVSRKLGYKDAGAPDAQVKSAMRILSSMHKVHMFSVAYIEKIYRRFGKQSPVPFPILKNSRQASGYYLLDKTLLVTSKPHKLKLNSLLELLADLPEEKIEFGGLTLYRMSYVSLPKSISQKSYRLLNKIIRKPYGHITLQALLDCGILEKLLTPFQPIRFLPQFDGYHALSVDLHSIHSVKALEELEEGFVRELFQQLSSDHQYLLKLVLLFHDVGKGRVREHSIVGEGLFKRYAKRLGLSLEDTQLGAFLIRHHILMSETARREDIYNRNNLTMFVSRVKNRKTLDLLHILTNCDIQAVGKGVLSNFVKKLLYELYQNALGIFEKKELLSETARRIKKEEALIRSRVFINLPTPLQKKTLSISTHLFFFKLNPKEITEVVQWTANTKQYDYRITNEEALLIEIVRKVPLNLGYLLGKLTYMNIASMDVFRLFDGAKYFRIEFHEKAEVDDAAMIAQICEDSFDMGRDIRLNAPRINKREITINAEHSDELAEIKINTVDQQGLLAWVSSVFDDLGIEIVTAKVHTHQKRVRDLFLVEKNDNFRKNQGNIKQAILGR